MKAIVMPGYGDRDDYLKFATRNWKRKYGVKPEVFVFGWDGDGDGFEPKLAAFEKKLLAEPGKVSLIAISASMSIALYAKQTYPNKVDRVVGLCGPVHKEVMNLKNYPLLDRSLSRLSLEDLPVQDIRVYYSPGDKVAIPQAVLLDGVDCRPVGHADHALTIGRVMFTKGREITEFINHDAA